ncbi:MAG: DUF4126 family protein [Pirellulaceae bacterium]|nr:DUF4126 family protein [Pirellulaceae bacterium]
MLETIVAVSLGIGLAAACGFRIFVPMVAVGLAARAEWLTLSDGFEWIASDPAILVFGIATALEIAAYYIPWVDNLLDSVATPAATVAGIVVVAACLYDMDPMLKWSLAIIAGGGTAAAVQTGTAGLRFGSTMLTGGATNPVVSTLEWFASLVMSILAVFLPILAAAVAVLLVIVLLRFAVRFVQRRRQGPKADPA